MDRDEKETPRTGLLDRFRKSWFPPAAAVGAVAALVAAVSRERPAPGPAPQTSRAPAAPEPPEQAPKPAQPPGGYPREYVVTALLGGGKSPQPFKNSLSGIALGAGDRIYALGDGEIRIFEANGDPVRKWKAAANAASLAAGAGGRVYVGAAGRVEVYEDDGTHAGGFAAGEKNRPADITAIKVFMKEILVADAAARIIRRYDTAGRQTGLIGDRNKTGGFMLPNHALDFDVDGKGVVYATDTGRHRVSAWALDGSPLGYFGKFGMTNPEDFVGCCNPVNVALSPDGTVVTGEKMVARVKVFDPDGKLLAVIGPEHFHPDLIHIHLAVDSKERILAADPVRREVRIFSLVVKVGENEPSRPPADRKPVEVEDA
ncbi:MAG: hypothetical protein FJW35_15730 [Acidobacteria bacterium]|nr:hypothetical protein [Acidobacteriota bacterium]